MLCSFTNVLTGSCEAAYLEEALFSPNSMIKIEEKDLSLFFHYYHSRSIYMLTLCTDSQLNSLTHAHLHTHTHTHTQPRTSTHTHTHTHTHICTHKVKGQAAGLSASPPAICPISPLHPVTHFITPINPL